MSRDAIVGVDPPGERAGPNTLAPRSPEPPELSLAPVVKFCTRPRLQTVADQIEAYRLQIRKAVCEAPLGCLAPQGRLNCQVVDGKENASTTTLNNQRSNIEDTMVNGVENVANGP